MLKSIANPTTTEQKAFKITDNEKILKFIRYIILISTKFTKFPIFTSNLQNKLCGFLVFFISKR